MARPQKFSEDYALEQAMGVFWEKGFHATSLSDLVDRTGVCRASLYKTFGDKEGLYNQALLHYQQLMSKRYARPLRKGEAVVDFLREFFRAKVQEVTEQKPEGCMFINATTELITKDEAIRNILVENETKQRNWLESVLEAGKVSNEFSADMDAKAMAHYLFTAFQGVTVNAMTQKNANSLYPVIDLFLSSLPTRLK